MTGASNTWTIAKRELAAYFASPVAYVFTCFFLLLSASFTFMLGGFFPRNEASLISFFLWHPWLYMFLVPAVGMRLWSEERRQGTLELLLTMPVTTQQAVLGKFLAGWLFLGLALLLTFPMIMTVAALGDPDGGVITCAYLGSFLMAGGFLAISSMTSSLTRNQVVSFIIAVVICFLLILAGWPPVTNVLTNLNEGAWFLRLLVAAAVVALSVVVLGLLRVAGVPLRGLVPGLAWWAATVLLAIVGFLWDKIGFLGSSGFRGLVEATAASLIGFAVKVSVMSHFDALQRGVIDLRDVAYFATLIAFALFATGVILRSRRA
jgi:ABC-2 type transport system permease protein